MTAQPPGRRTESLFDNRYRYDHIYPRGRSGETLRAYDTQDNDRPVVIKRPAPQDAPPMRAGQEVSIRTEKQALERLSGHPVLTELCGSGTFRVGGHTHEYIVMDLARGQIVENMVLELAEHGEYLPELESLVIVDMLLDLLALAHDKQVIYNDVDAKHLFWDREHYRLKVIDWGNAVFLDEPGALPNATRSSDVYQCGELLYFILTGGNRLSVEVEEGGETFFVNFGTDAERIAPRLQTILTRAVHPDPKRRFGTVLELRHALTEYRVPLERTRDEIIARVRKRVRVTASQDELEELNDALRSAISMDPGFPDATALTAEIQSYIKQIGVQADLDAIRIYLESGNWPRALFLLHDLLPDADETHATLIRFLIAAAATLENLHISPPPAGFLDALDPLFAGDAPDAGNILVTTGEARPAARQALWLLAEQLAVYLPDVTLLRPHLVRLRHELQNVPDAAHALDWVGEVEANLAQTPVPGLTGLQIVYQQTAASLERLEATLETLGNEHDNETWLASAIRAQRAAHDIVSRLDDVGHQVFSDPAQASEMLRAAAMIDPASRHFDTLHDYFDEVHQAVTALAQFRPRSDGDNLAGWFVDVREFIQLYLDDLPDPQLHAAADALHQAAEGWTTIVNYLALGRRQPTIQALRSTADAIRPFNEHIAAWLGALANNLPDALYVERLSPNKALADQVIEGWKAWDRGDIIQAAELGRQARDAATTDGERLAADRLRRLANLLDGWLADEGYKDIQRTDRAETEALAILLSDEEHERQTFAEQMPNTTTYLRAMTRGIVAFMHQSSSAGWRALYMHYVLRGMLALLNADLDEAAFWRDVASKSFDNARTHRAFQFLDRTLTARRLIDQAQQTLNAVTGPQDLDAVRQALNAPLAGEVLTGAQQSIQLANEALRSWSDGDFYSARQALDSALANMQTAIEAANLSIDPFMTWLTGLRDAAADLHQTRLAVEQAATSTSEDPDPALEDAHRHIVAVTLESIGPDFVHQVRQWDDMYRAVLETYTTQRLTRREKLAAFSRHFASLFITRHPAYPLFRHWEAITEQLPPDETEDDMIELDAVPPAKVDSPAFLEDDIAAEPVERRERGDGTTLPWNWIIGLALVALIVAGGLAVLRTMRDDNQPDAPPGPPPTAVLGTAPGIVSTNTQIGPVAASPVTTGAAGVAMPPASTPAPPTSTPAPPTDTPSPVPTTTPLPTVTASLIPTQTSLPTDTPTLFVTSTLIPSRTPVPVAAAPAANTNPGTGGANSDVLAALAALPITVRPGPTGAFVPGENGSWVLSTAPNGGRPVSIDLPPELISVLFQPGAASSIRRADATLELVRYDQASLANGGVAFGLGAENTGGQRTIGEVQFIEANFVSLGLNQGGRFRSSTQFPQQNPQIVLSVRRTDANTLGFFVDDRWLGDSVFIFPQGDPLSLILYVSGNDVVVNVSSFEIDYSPRDEIP